MTTKTTITAEQQAIKDAQMAANKARRRKMTAFLRGIYEDKGLVQQTTFNHANYKMDKTIHGDDIRYVVWCRGEAERISADPNRKAEVLEYDGKVALFVDNNTDEAPSFRDDD